MKSKQKRAWMTPSEVSLFCQQVELLLQSGIPLYEGMRSLADNYQSTPYREALTELAQKVDETGSLYEGMRKSPLVPGLCPGNGAPGGTPGGTGKRLPWPGHLLRAGG